MKIKTRYRLLRAAFCCLVAFGGVFAAHAVTVPAVPYPSASYDAYPGYIKVTWSRVTGATYGYYIYRSTSSSWSTRTYLTAVSSSTTSILDHSVVDGVTYYYWVCPKYYKSGSSYWYAYNQYRYDYGRSKVIVPPSPTVSTTYENYIKITWTPNSSSAPYGYYIRRSTSSSFSSSTWIATVSNSSTSYYDYSASRGTTYYYWICPRYYYNGSTYYYAYNSSAYDYGWRKIIPPVPTPSCSTSYNGYVKITWSQSSSSVYGYYIRRSTTSSFSNSTLLTRITSPSTTTYYDYSATPGTTYYYWVCPIYTYASSTGSYWYYYDESKKDWGKSLAPIVPDPTCSVSYDSYVKITWSQSSSSVYGYYIRRSTTSNFSNSISLTRITSPSTTTYYDYSANRGTTYYYWVCPIYSYVSSTGSYWYYYNEYNWDYGYRAR
jgi:hypothetical protein